MESYNPYPSTKKTIIILLIVIIAALILSVAIIWKRYSGQLHEMSNIQEYLQKEKIELSGQLKDLSSDFNSLKSRNDTMNMKLDSARIRIQGLLTIKASNTATIMLYKKELSTLREVMKSYIVQIDSLNQKNIFLISENRTVRNKLAKSEETNEMLNVRKSQLDSLVKTASVHNAKDVEGWGLDKRGKETTKASRVQKIKVCLTVRENPIIDPGPIEIFLRIFTPDNELLADSPNNLFLYNDAQTIYTTKRQVGYENKDLDVCIYWNAMAELKRGNYNIEVYTENNLIGKSIFLLK